MSKVNTVFQVAGVILVLLTGISSQFVMPATLCIYLVAGLTILSGVDYIYRASAMTRIRMSRARTRTVTHNGIASSELPSLGMLNMM